MYGDSSPFIIGRIPPIHTTGWTDPQRNALVSVFSMCSLYRRMAADQANFLDPLYIFEKAMIDQNLISFLIKRHKTIL